MSKSKQLFEEAANLNHQAMELLQRFEGKEMPAEESTRFDELIEQAEAKKSAADRILRGEQQHEHFTAPATRLPFFGKTDEKAATGGPARSNANDDVQTKAFRKALLNGMGALNDSERKALAADNDTTGGFLQAPEQVTAQIIKFVDDQVYFRSIADVQPVASAQSLGVVTIESDPSDADWTSEVASVGEDSSMALGKRALYPHPLSKLIKISRKLLRASTRPVEQLVMSRLAYKFGVSEEKGFLTGNGAGQPLGVYTASAQGISTSRDTTCAGTTTFTADELIDVKYSTKVQYHKNAHWLISRGFLKRARKLKDGNGQYIWQQGLQAGAPNTLLENPYLVSEFAPDTFTTGQYVAVYGDFKFYMIAEALNMEIQVVDQLYAATNQMGYIGRMEVDGMPVLEEAFARLKLG